MIMFVTIIINKIDKPKVIGMNKDDDPKGVKLPRVSKGERPKFFDDPAIDQMMTFFLELMTEVSVLRERVDTVERLLDAALWGTKLAFLPCLLFALAMLAAIESPASI